MQYLLLTYFFLFSANFVSLWRESGISLILVLTQSDNINLNTTGYFCLPDVEKYFKACKDVQIVYTNVFLTKYFQLSQQFNNKKS